MKERLLTAREVSLIAPATPASDRRRSRMRAWIRRYDAEITEPQPPLPLPLGSTKKKERRPRRPWSPLAGQTERGKYPLFGEVLSLPELSALCGLAPVTLRNRLHRGMTVAQAIRALRPSGHE